MSTVSVPAIGSKAPEFTVEAVVDGAIKNISLSQYKGKYVVLFFYPLDFTFVCPTEIISFSDKAAEFRAIGCEVIGGSIDSAFSHLAWIKQSPKQGGLGPMNIPLIADVNRSVSQSYGALLGNSGHTLRATFIINPEGVVRHFSFNEPPVGRNVDEILRLVQAFQFVDKHGEVCPMNWRPGQPTMHADPVKSQTYFEAHGKA